MNTASHVVRRGIAAVTATALGICLAGAPVAYAAPTGQVPAVRGLDRFPDSWDYQGGPDWSPGSSTAQSSLDTQTATSSQETGLVLISTRLAGGTGAGTGMVIDEDGIVLTNHHVVEGAESISVTIATTGQTYQGVLVGTDSQHDVAVLRLVGADDLTEVTTTAEIATGDAVVAVGDATGDGGDLTAAAGVVSGLHEEITVTNDDGTTSELSDLIEVDADIVAGDSGGALLDDQGRVVGMNTAASAGYVDITGYAIPIETALEVADQILAGDESGSVQIGYNGYLGVLLSAYSGTTTIVGVADGSPADSAGLTAGDTITAIAGVEVSSADELAAQIASHDGGSRVTVAWTTTSGAIHTQIVTLGQAIS